MFIKSRLLVTCSAVALIFSIAFPAYAVDNNITGASGALNLNNNDTATISSTGSVADPNLPAININGDNTTTINSGTVASTFSDTISSGGNNTMITNKDSGFITSNSDGIRIAGGSAIINNNDIANINSAGGNGIEITGGTATINNNDNATIYSTGSDGVNIGGGTSGSILNNNDHGHIYSTVASGLNIDGDNATVHNDGTIDGVAFGIRVTGNNNTITSNGITIGNGDDIKIIGANDKLILGSNATGSGAGSAVLIDFIGASNGILQYTTGSSFPSEGGGFGTAGGAAPNYTIIGGTLGTNYTIDAISSGGTLPRNAVLVNSGGNTLAVTPDEFAGAEATIVNQSAADAGNLVVQRQQDFLLNENLTDTQDTIKTASADQLNNTASAAGGHPNRVAWAEGFGSYQERPADGDSAYSRARSGGALTGLDNAESNAGYRSGFFVGGFSGQNDLGKTHFRTIDSKGALIGGYIGKTYDGVYFSGQLQGGYSDNDSDRNVAGDVAKANYNSYFLAPSVTAMRPFALNNVIIAPSATIRYTAQYAEGYTETGSTANQDVDNRTTQTIGGRVQVEAHLPQQGGLKPSFRLGVDGETNLGNDHVDLNVLGTDVSLDPAGNNTVDGIVGLNLAYQTQSGPELYLDGESHIGLNKSDGGDNIGVTGRAGIRWAF